MRPSRIITPNMHTIFLYDWATLALQVEALLFWTPFLQDSMWRQQCPFCIFSPLMSQGSLISSPCMPAAMAPLCSLFPTETVGLDGSRWLLTNRWHSLAVSLVVVCPSTLRAVGVVRSIVYGPSHLGSDHLFLWNTLMRNRPPGFGSL